MLKSFFILISSVVFLFGSIEKGDALYNEKKFDEALQVYKKEYEKYPQEKKIKFRLILTHLKIGDRHFNKQSYKRAKQSYKKAYLLGSKKAYKSLGKLYEKEALLYEKGNNYQEALTHFQLAKKFGNEKPELEIKIQKMKELTLHQSRLKNDTRKIVNGTSPIWTRSIGRLIVPTNRTQNGKKIEKCSATLVNFENYEASKVIISASHCIKDFDSSVGALRFLIYSNSGKIIQKYAKIITDSKFDLKKMTTNSDYIILLLGSHIKRNEVEPLKVPSKSFLHLQRSSQKSFGSLGGFSSDIGDFGASLTYDPKCNLSHYNNVYAKSDCSGYKGSSGGPVVLSLFKDEKIKHYFVGVVSHFQNDRFEEIFFAPHHIFYDDIKNAIEKNNY